MTTSTTTPKHAIRTRFGWLLAPFAALAFPFMLTACNTVDGAGEDIEQAGEAISDSSD